VNRDQNILGIPIGNFHQVSDELCRGGQPGEPGLIALRDLQIKSVVSLRWRKKRISSEQVIAERLGLRFFSIPLNYWTLPNSNDIKAFLEIVDNVENQPVFVHCFHGADRTGVLVAMYRILRNDWSLQEAYKEMRQCGHHRITTAHFKLALWRLAREAAKETSPF
jgi:tyrosine-protein phosphatase SIW14